MLSSGAMFYRRIWLLFHVIGTLLPALTAAGSVMYDKGSDFTRDRML